MTHHKNHNRWTFPAGKMLPIGVRRMLRMPGKRLTASQVKFFKWFHSKKSRLWHKNLVRQLVRELE